ncbi:hypothetical protein D3C78_1237950 [compost metagenome]
MPLAGFAHHDAEVGQQVHAFEAERHRTDIVEVGRGGHSSAFQRDHDLVHGHANSRDILADGGTERALTATVANAVAGQLGTGVDAGVETFAEGFVPLDVRQLHIVGASLQLFEHVDGEAHRAIQTGRVAGSEGVQDLQALRLNAEVSSQLLCILNAAHGFPLRA